MIRAAARCCDTPAGGRDFMAPREERKTRTCPICRYPPTIDKDLSTEDIGIKVKERNSVAMSID